MRVIVCVLGRRAGKTTCVQRFLRLALERPLNIGWYGHVRRSAKQAWRYALGAMPASAITRKDASELELELVNGSLFQFGSMEVPENNRGQGHDIVVLDEGARMSVTARDDVAAAMVGDSQLGIIVVFTTPKGKRGRGGWVYRDFKKAEGRQPGYEKLHGRTEENPLQAVKQWAAWARQSLPEAVVRQELDAEFLDAGLGALDLRPVATLGGSQDAPVTLPYADTRWLESTRREPCSVGFDPARVRDYFACAAIGCETRRLRGLIRFHGLDWPEQVAKAAEFWRRFSGGQPACTDATGVGDAVASMLRQEGVRVRPVNFASRLELGDQRFDVDARTVIVQGLQVATERRQWSMPYIEELIAEAETFEAELLSSGRVRYAAAEGFTDDLIFAVGLGLLGLPQIGAARTASGVLKHSEMIDPARAGQSHEIFEDDEDDGEDWQDGLSGGGRSMEN